MLRRFSPDGDLSHINSIEFRLFAATCICCPVAQDVVHQHVEWHSKQTLIEGPGTEEQKSSPSFLSFGDRSLLLCGPSAAQNKHWGLQGCHFLDRRSHKSCQTMTAMTLKKCLELETLKSTAMDLLARLPQKSDQASPQRRIHDNFGPIPTAGW